MSSPNNAYKTYRNLTTTGATSAETGILSCAVGMHRGGGVQITGTFSATLQFEETLDGGTTWIAKTVYPAGGGAGVTATTTTGQWKFANGGSTNFRVRCSTYGNGTAAVALTLTEGVDPVAGNTNPLPIVLAGDSVTLTKTSVTMSGSSATLVSADATRTVVLVSNTDSNAVAAIDPTGGTAALDAGIPILPGETKKITGKAAQSAMTQIGTSPQKLTVYTG